MKTRQEFGTTQRVLATLAIAGAMSLATTAFAAPQHPGAQVLSGAATNSATGTNSVVVGGSVNTATGAESFVGAGDNNTATSSDDAVVTGSVNTANGGDAAVLGGNDNNAIADDAVIGGGESNTASGAEGGVFSGRSNAATGTQSGVGVGKGNTASAQSSFIGGGSGNQATGSQATIGGGTNNNAGGLRGRIGGGFGNATTMDHAFVGAGQLNTASGESAVVCGGAFNVASGLRSAVLGGASNTATGNFSMACGRNARAVNFGCFVFSDFGPGSGLGAFTTVANNEFAARATGGVRFVTSSAGNGVRLFPGAGAWSALSDRASKENFAPVDAEEVLEKVESLPVMTWNYKTQDEAIRHIGPVAQDFAGSFAVGESDTTITTIDADGVALAAIQALAKKARASDAENVRLREELAETRQRLDRLERKLMQP